MVTQHSREALEHAQALLAEAARKVEAGEHADAIDALLDARHLLTQLMQVEQRRRSPT
jgi:hypothetical protein